jgi:hypothetical protein
MEREVNAFQTELSLFSNPMILIELRRMREKGEE